MAYIVSPIAYACLLFLLVAYAVWDTLVVLLFILRACVELVVVGGKYPARFDRRVPAPYVQRVRPDSVGRCQV